jgi:hypothetical protein
LAGEDGGEGGSVGGGDRGRGLDRSIAVELDLAAGDFDSEALRADPQLVVRAQLAGRLGVEERAQGEDDRVGADLLGVGREGGAGAPGAELGHDRLQLLSPLGQLVDRGGRWRRQFATLYDARLLEAAQALGDHVRAGVREAAAQVGEALWAEQQFANDKQCPALSDDVEGMGETTRLTI